MKELGPVFIWGIREKIGEMITKKRKLIGIISMIMISSMMIGECKLIVSADDESNIIDEEHENLIQDNEQKEVGEDEINKEETTLDNAEKSVRETEIQGRSVVNFNKGWQFNKK